MQPASWTARVAFVGALLCAAVLAPVASTPVSAADAAQQLATVRADVDRLGNEYFAARQRLQQLDSELARLHTQRARVERSYVVEHRFAVERAVARYTAGAYVTTDATSALDAATTSVLLEHAAARTNATMAHYIRVRNTMLDTEQRIAAEQRAQRALVAELSARTRVLDRELATAQRAYREVLAARAAQAQAASHTQATAGRTNSTTSAPPVPPARPQPVPTPAPPSPPGTNPHHGDPFLSCVRQRESHGYYGAVNPGGYYGAYQFATTTWDITASHAGMPALIGVRPDHAGPWDQDQLAWILFQWQGEAPWGGHCP